MNKMFNMPSNKSTSDDEGKKEWQCQKSRFTVAVAIGDAISEENANAISSAGSFSSPNDSISLKEEELRQEKEARTGVVSSGMTGTSRPKSI